MIGLVFGAFEGCLLTGAAIREWAFGFPSIIKEPPSLEQNELKQSGDERHELMGQTGHTVSALVPTGSVLVDGQKMSATSDTGQLIDAETPVVVVKVRNSVLHVRRCDAIADFSGSEPE